MPQDDTRETRINNAFNSVGTLLKGTRDLGDGLALDLTEEFYLETIDRIFQRPQA